MGAVMRHLQEVLPDDAILTNGAGNFAIWPAKLFKYGPKQRLLGPQSGAMGAGVPAAVAAKAENRDRTVVCFAGDGDFPDDRDGTWRGPAGGVPAHCADFEQRYVWHHPHASGT